MKNFAERLTPTVQTRALLSSVPYIIISRKALDKMYAYVDNCADEVGWLGTATRDGREIYIQDTYLFDQEVHATTTEITPEGLSDFAMELLQQPDGVDIWNNMKVWGHSHVNMGVTPSGQDDAQMATFKEGGHDWFIRLIANKKGDLKIDLYEYHNGLIYLDLPWEAEIDEEEENVQAQIAILEEQLMLLRSEKADLNTSGIDAEMKVKVRKKVYVTGVNSNHSNWASRGNQATTSTTNGTVQGGTDVKKNGLSAKTNGRKGNATGANYEFFENDDQVLDEFGLAQVLEFAECKTLEELDEMLVEFGWWDTFTDDDLERVYRVAKKVYFSVGGDK